MFTQDKYINLKRLKKEKVKIKVVLGGHFRKN